jgi:hypothetical protein
MSQLRLLTLKCAATLLPIATLALSGCKSTVPAQEDNSTAQGVDSADGRMGGGFFGRFVQHAKDEVTKRAVTKARDVLLNPESADALCDELVKRGLLGMGAYQNCQGRIQTGQSFASGFLEGGAEDISNTAGAVMQIGQAGLAKLEDPHSLAVDVIHVTEQVDKETLFAYQEAIKNGSAKESAKALYEKVKNCGERSKAAVTTNPNTAGKVTAHAALMIFELAKAAKVARRAEEAVEAAGAAGGRIKGILDAVTTQICEDLEVSPKPNKSTPPPPGADPRMQIE